MFNQFSTEKKTFILQFLPSSSLVNNEKVKMGTKESTRGEDSPSVVTNVGNLQENPTQCSMCRLDQTHTQTKKVRNELHNSFPSRRPYQLGVICLREKANHYEVLSLSLCRIFA